MVDSKTSGVGLRTPFEDGRDVIKRFAVDLPDKPGVYRMCDVRGEVLYVGKARALRRRVMSYTQRARLPVRLQRMVALTRGMEFVLTHTEAEALLLESNLIKKLRPRFNILLRDDKSFPYILMRQDHDYPMPVKYRGKKQKGAGVYYGPYAGAGDVNRTLQAMQRVFLLRNCSDANFASRERPCLQYHIKRCSAPCVGLVSKDEYAQQVQQASDFLEGRSEALRVRLRAEMDHVSAAMDYERAAEFRDRLKALAAIDARQDVNFEGLGQIDVVALAQEGGRSCVQVFFVRNGRNHGNQAFFPQHGEAVGDAEVMASFLAQFYAGKMLPPEIVVSEVPEEQGLLQEAFSEIAGHNVKIVCPQRGARRKLIDFALMNAREALSRRLVEHESTQAHLDAVAEIFGMDASPERIEVYDNSHIAGSYMTGAMIVAGADGFVKNSYRKFNIKSAKAADDYGMMREVMRRRFGKIAVQTDEGDAVDADLPDLLLIDGGKGQLGAVYEVLDEVGLSDRVTVVGIAKGEERNAGREQFFMRGRESFVLPMRSSALFYLQRLRDEAHRFALGSHRVRRRKGLVENPLDDIDGIGPKKKSALLRYFGSAKAVSAAGLEDLRKVDGVSDALARAIYEHFHG